MPSLAAPASRRDFPWLRYWYDSESSGQQPPAGFLYVPPERYAAFYSSRAYTLPELESHRCTLLLGEPGAGKSRALAAYADSRPGTLCLDLKEFRDAEAVANEIERSAEFTRWREGGELHLALDSFDELQLRDPGLAGGLLRHFRRWLGHVQIGEAAWADLLARHPAHADELAPLARRGVEGWEVPLPDTRPPDDVKAEVMALMGVGRCTLRLACRPGELPETLRQGLGELFAPVGGARTFLLAPLRFEDAREAAELSDLDGDRFMVAVARHDVELLAANPGTLDMLLDEFARSATLPESQNELFSRACLRLCSEPDADRGRGATYSPAERRVAAGRLAFLSVFANLEVVARGDAPSTALPATSALGEDQAHGRSLDVGLPLIRSALEGGVFAGAGGGLHVWRHRRYREYLAAWYMHHRNLPLAQVRALLLHPVDGRVVPQLGEVASFLASMRADVHDLLVEADPVTLLRSDLGLRRPEERARVAAALLAHFESGDLVQSDRGLGVHLRKLAHPELADQLRLFIQDPARNREVRWFALDVAGACGVLALVPELLHLALNRREDHHLRQEAARAVVEVNDEAGVRALRPLALAQGDDDPDDQLKGIALLALWPRFLSAEELFGVLSPPKVPNLLGSYKVFLGEFGREEGEGPRFVADLRDEDVPRALAWARTHTGGRWSLDAAAQAADAVMSRASRLLDRDDVAHPFVDNVLARWVRHTPGVGASVPALETQFVKDLEADAPTRRRLLALLLERSEEAQLDHWSWRASSREYARPEDMAWLVEFARQAPRPQARAALKIAARLLDWNDAEARDRWRALGREWELAREVLDVDAWEARALDDEVEPEPPEPQAPTPPPVEEFVRAAEARLGPGTWFALLHRLRESGGPSRPFDLDVLQAPAWGEADDALRGRVLRLAARFLHEQDAPPLKRLVRTTKVLGDFAAVGAVHLINLGAHGEMTDELWAKWAGVVLTFPAGSDGPESAAHQPLIEQAYQAAPEATLRAALMEARAEDGAFGTVFVTRKLRAVWDDRLDEGFSALLGGRRLDRAWGSVLYELLERGSVRAQRVARRYARLEDSAAPRAVAAMQALLAFDFERAWPAFWNSVQRRPAFAEAALTAYVNLRHGSGLAARLNEAQAADLFLWLADHVPHAQDSEPLEADYTSGLRDGLVRLREELLRNLQARGSRAACDALARVRGARPDLAWLKWTHLEALAEWRRRTWVWSTPEVLLDLVARAERRLVRSDDELLEVVLESLERLEHGLVRQETPLAEFLWNTWVDEQDDERWKPKDEEALSNWVKHHLQEDLGGRGIVVGREVEVRRGQFTDVHVTALRPTRAGEVGDPVKVIVEVKGYWYSTLVENLRTQLAEGYLGDGEVSRGVYLVGWYNSPLWHDRPRKTWMAEKLRRDLDDRAAAASVEGRRVVARLIDVRPPIPSTGRRRKA
ncbi:HEAT repeat domain-containing protein [Deinococcus aestuarii]|uniref:HEAT repeat domain-containing protein n=1 Tax=Deinococcus aestuarii TaxID=2774531 RepID=UPI001C0C3DBB|nr:HEAT repeat domain-containing protein [Deinococcus aestuarii]